MGRNPERNVYLTIGIPRASQTYHRLVTEAQESDISLSKLIVLRLGDWYRMNLHQMILVTESSANIDHQQSYQRREQPAPEECTEHNERQGQQNAALALDAWL